MAPKKAKVYKSLPPLLFTNAIHSDEIPLELPSPLTPLSTDAEKSIMVLAQSDRWHRYASQGFQLPGELEEALRGPKDPGRLHVFSIKQRADTRDAEPESDIQIKLADGVKKLIKDISEDIIQTWPPYPEDTSKNTLLLVNSYAFTTQAFKPMLQPMVNMAYNLQQVGDQNAASVPLELQKLLEVASSFRPGTLSYFHLSGFICCNC
jgi:hypothetical protein